MLRPLERTWGWHVGATAASAYDASGAATAAQAAAVQRANHAGTQLAATVSDLNAAAVSVGSGTYDAAGAATAAQAAAIAASAQRASNLSDLNNAAIARTNLGLGSAATSASSAFDAAGATSSIVDAKGDLLAGTADNTLARLGVGANGRVLKADSSTASGLAWATASAVVDVRLAQRQETTARLGTGLPTTRRLSSLGWTRLVRLVVGPSSSRSASS